MTRFVLVEWVGRWALAHGRNDSVAPLFSTEEEVRAWVRGIYQHDPLDIVMTRFRVVPAELPESMTPTFPEPKKPWSGAYAARDGEVRRQVAVTDDEAGEIYDALQNLADLKDDIGEPEDNQVDLRALADRFATPTEVTT